MMAGIHRQHVPDGSVDLVYLDPPFNSDANYNVLFAEKDGTKAAAQIQAFGDTWEWNQASAAACDEAIQRGGRLADALRAFRAFLGSSDMMAYLAMMAPRLAELRRVMKDTGSLYLHCDPTASHYLKILLDAVFGPEHFRNEIIWRRTGSHNSARRFGPIHDVILFYTKSDSYTWNPFTRPYMIGHVKMHFKQEGNDYRTNYSGNVLSGSGRRGGESGKPWRGFDPDSKGRHWAVPKKILAELDENIAHLSTHRKLEHLYKSGLLTITPGDEWPRYTGRIIGPDDGQSLSDLWAYQPYTEGTVFGTDLGIDDDVRWMGTSDAERLGYPTQKPVTLLGRIIRASSNKGDVVLDPFCGCGTTVAAAQNMERRWIGIDITHLAIGLIRHRLQDAYGKSVEDTYEVIGEPISLPDAEELAHADPYQFQWWALGLVGARPTEQKKGADKGIDGRIYLHEVTGGDTKQIVLSVKAGHTGPNHVSELRGVMEREKAILGVLITMQEPTKAMIREAASAGFYASAWGQHPRLQILTVRELLEGRQIDSPPVRQTSVTYRRAPRVPSKAAEQPSLYGVVPKPAKATLRRQQRRKPA